MRNSTKKYFVFAVLLMIAGLVVYNPARARGYDYNFSFGGLFDFFFPFTFFNAGDSPPRRTNQPPLWLQTPPQQAAEGQMIQFTVSAHDPESATVTYSAINVPSGASFNVATKTFSWMPTVGQRGSYTVIFRASDGRRSADMIVYISVSKKVDAQSYPTNPYDYYNSYYNYNYDNNYYYQISSLNAPPVLFPIAPQAVRVGEQIVFEVLGYSPSNNWLVYTATNLPQGAAFDGYSHVFYWVPTATQMGQYNVNFRAADGLATADISVPITVYDYNGLIYGSGCSAGPGPYFFDFNPPLIVREGELYTYQIVGGSGNNNPVTYRLVEGPQGITINQNTGHIRWVPAFNQGRSSPYLVRVAAYNGQCESIRSFYITVQDVDGR